MVLDITSVAILVFLLVGENTLEFSHNDFSGFSHDVCKSVQTTSMSHTDDESARTLLDSRVDAELEPGDEGLTALEAETLHRVKLAGHEGAPGVGPV